MRNAFYNIFRYEKSEMWWKIVSIISTCLSRENGTSLIFNPTITFPIYMYPFCIKLFCRGIEWRHQYFLCHHVNTNPAPPASVAHLISNRQRQKNCFFLWTKVLINGLHWWRCSVPSAYSTKMHSSWSLAFWSKCPETALENQLTLISIFS